MAYTTGKMRWRLMNQACDLAGSGEHADYRSVLVQIQVDPHYERVRRWIEDVAFLAQLDRLCDLAQKKAA
jgi:hypothetical protein